MTRRKYPDLQLTIEDITPELAKAWLETNTHNRKVSDRLVEVYADAMENKEWVLNGEPIIFDYNERLQSGQHRLLAVISSGVTIRSVVVRGAEPDYIYSLDSGRKRRLTDVLTLRGEKDVANLSAALVWHWRYTQGLMERPGITPTTTHMLAVLDAVPDLRDFVRIAGRAKAKGVQMSTGLMAALFYEFSSINRGDFETFLEKLSTGADLSSDHPIYALRRWLTRTSLQQSKPPQAVYGAILVKAWNAYRNHETPRSLRWRADEVFPEVG